MLMQVSQELLQRRTTALKFIPLLSRLQSGQYCPTISAVTVTGVTVTPRGESRVADWQVCTCVGV